LTITVDQFGYNNNLEELETECEKLFGNLNYAYEMKGQMTGDESELVYVFESNADLTNAKAAVEAYFKAATVQKDGVFEGMYITVSTNSEVIKANIAQDYLLRAAIAGAVMLVLAFVYVSLRYRVSVGALTVLSGILGGALTTAIVILARIPVSVSVSYAIVVAALLAMVATLLTMSKARLNQASESEMEKSAEDQVVSAIAGKEICAMTVLGGVAIIFMGALATTAVRWFAVVALIGLLVSAFIGLFCVPAWYLPMKKAADKAVDTVKRTAKKAKIANLAIIIQSPLGGNITVEEIADKVPADADAVFVRVDQNKLWWTRGDEKGDVDIWE
jgi:preprotein translocase subunit SecF